MANQRKTAAVLRGAVYLAAFNASGTPLAYIPIGNSPKLELTHSEDTKELPSYDRPGGGTDAYYTTIKSVEVAGTITHISPDNLARLIHGEVSDFAAAPAQTVTLKKLAKAEFIPAPALWTPGSVVVKRNTPAAWAATTAYAVGDRVKSGSGATTRSHIVTVAGTSGASAPTWSTTGTTTTDGTVTWQDEGLIKTYAAGSDYLATAGGIKLPTGSTIPDGELLDITYDRPAQYQIDALTHSARDWALYFDGWNESDSDAPVSLTIPLVKFGAAKSLPMIGEDFVKLEFSGRVLRSNDSVSGAAAYYTLRATASA